MDDKTRKKMGIQKKSETVRVVIRCRPLSKKETAEGREKVVNMDHKNGEILVQKSVDEVPKRFTFDCVYDENTHQKDIFDETAFPIIENILEGYNGTIFAYGQTGTGKTHTMSGVLDSEELKGITPRAFETIFKSINIDETKQYLVRASYLEIYKEEVLDLLNKGGVQKLELKEKPGSGVYVKDLSAVLVENPEKLMEIMIKGNKNRHVGQTKMNHESSRSHSIFTVTVECAEVGADGKAHIKVGKLNMVDLAGSEKQSKTQSEGERFEEAIKINLSLTTLCHVISSLVDGKAKYVPYRDSKLTRLLQDSLGGNTKTVMIANVGPADYNMDETLSTLRYASRAKHIQNKPRINEDPKDAMLREFQEEIQRLRQQLEMAGAGKINPDGTPAAPGGVVEVEKVVYEADKKQMKKLEKKLEKEKLDIKKKADEKRKKIIEQKNIAEDERQKLLDDLKKKEQDQEKSKTKQQKLLKRLKNMEEKVLQGNEVMNKAMKQEIELQKAKAEVEEKRREQLRINQELQEAEDRKIDLQKSYKTQQDELVGKKGEYQKIWTKYRSALEEKNDLEIDIQRERESLMMRIRELTNDIRLKHLILDNYIPASEYVKIERRAEWNEELKEWQIPSLEYTGNNIKKNKKAQKEGKKIGDPETNFLYEHILNFEEDSEEEDYKEAATQRVKNMISNILVEEGEDEQLAATADQQQAIYYKYTENGAEREDPEKSKKKKDKKKKAGASAKRPITAKKMKKGDIVSMVETMTNAQHVNKLENKKAAKGKHFPKAKGL